MSETVAAPVCKTPAPRRAATLHARQLRDGALAGKPDLRLTLQALLGAPGLSQAEWEALLPQLRRRSVSAHADIFTRQQPGTHLVGLHEGVAALGYRGEDGVFRLERIVSAPAWLDQSAAWLDQPHALDAQAAAPCVVVEMPLEAVRQTLAAHTAMAERLLRGLAQETRQLSVAAHDLMHKDAPARLASWMLARCEADNADAPRLVWQLHGRKRDLASQLAITPETLSRLLRSFTRQGVIGITGYTVRVLNLPALRQMAA